MDRNIGIFGIAEIYNKYTNANCRLPDGTNSIGHVVDFTGGVPSMQFFNGKSIKKYEPVKEAMLLLKNYENIEDGEVLEIAQCLHPGNDRCTILKKKGLVYTIDVDSRSSAEFSLQITLDFGKDQFTRIHGYDFNHDLGYSTWMLHEWFIRNNYNVEQFLGVNHECTMKTPVEMGIAEFIK